MTHLIVYLCLYFVKLYGKITLTYIINQYMISSLVLYYTFCIAYHLLSTLIQQILTELYYILEEAIEMSRSGGEG